MRKAVIKGIIKGCQILGQMYRTYEKVFHHQENVCIKGILHRTPLLHRKKTWVNRGITIFIIFNRKPKLWTLVQQRSRTYHFFFLMKFSIFNAEKILCIWHGQVLVMLVKIIGDSKHDKAVHSI